MVMPMNRPQRNYDIEEPFQKYRVGLWTLFCLQCACVPFVNYLQILFTLGSLMIILTFIGLAFLIWILYDGYRGLKMKMYYQLLFYGGFSGVWTIFSLIHAIMNLSERGIPGKGAGTGFHSWVINTCGVVQWIEAPVHFCVFVIVFTFRKAVKRHNPALAEQGQGGGDAVVRNGNQAGYASCKSYILIFKIKF